MKLTTHQLGQLPTDRQTDAQPAVFAGHGTIELVEALIERLFVTMREADAAVADLEDDLQVIVLRLAAADPHVDAAFAGELDTVVDQAGQAQRELLGVPLQTIGQPRRPLDGERQPLGMGLATELHLHAVEQRLQAERFIARIEPPGLQFGQDQNVVDHAHHVPRRACRSVLILGQLRSHGHGLHQLQRADHAIHRRAQFVGDGGQEFVLQAVACRQFLVRQFQLEAGFLEGLRLLVAQHVDAVGQRQRQQADLQRRADLTGVHGDEHVGQVAQHHQGVDDAAQQERAPGNDEIARQAHAAQPGDDTGGEDHYGETQRQRRGQTQRQGVAGRQRQRHDHGAVHHQADQQPIHPTTVAGGL